MSLLLPTTSLGKWSIGLAIVMPVLFVLGSSFTNTLYAGVPAGNSIGEDLESRPVLALTMLAAVLSGITAAALGVLAIQRQRERGALVYYSTALGFLLLLFLAGELLLAE